MAIKNCCIEDCFSCSSKEEDVGVTYHKFPKDKALRDIWIKITQFIDKDVNLPYYVCSRHFCKSDFQSLEDSKYVLKSDAVPSIFPWTIRDISDINMESNEKETDASSENNIDNNNIEPMQAEAAEVDKQQPVQSDEPKLDNVDVENAEVGLDTSKESEGEGIEAIRKFIEEQEKEIQELQAEVKPHTAKIVLELDSTKDEAIATEKLESKDEAKGSKVAISENNVICDVSDGALKQDDKSHVEKTKEDTSDDTEHHEDNSSDKTKTGDSNDNKTISGTSNDNKTQVKDKKPKKDILLEEKLVQHDDVSMAVASDVMNIILSKSEAKLAKPTDGVKTHKHLLSGEKGTSAMALSVGSKIEAKDFGEHWHPANIAEVDYDEMEVLVRYENLSNKHDEWISVSSPRLRPQGSPSKAPPEPISEPVIKEEPREEKPKMPYKVGDRCLARWRDNRRFQATVLTELGDGNYEVVFDDGFVWRCPVARLSKMKDGDSKPSLSVPLQVNTALSPAPSPLPTPPGSAAPPYHTHLFDPARDFLGSKSDRRERKRKLNIKEIFNIGQKKKKDDSAPAKKIKAEPVEKKPKVVKQKVESAKGIQIKTEVKPVLPDAVASIIGSVAEQVPVKTEVEEVEIKEEEQPEQKEYQKTDVTAEAEEDKMQVDEVVMIDPSLPVDTEVQEEDEPKNDTNDDSLPIKDDEEMLKILEAYNKLEDKFNKPISPEHTVTTVKPEPKPQIKDKTKASKVKKAKKLKQLRDTAVNEEVLKVKIELEAVKSQLAAIKKRAGLNADEWLKDQAGGHPIPMPDSYLLPGMWCCKWHNGEPVGISEMQFESKDAKGLPRRSVQVEDKRLPPGWSKHMVRRSLGSSAGKWDVVIVAPDNKRLHTKTDMRHYLEGIRADEDREALEPFEHVLLDFGVHRKMARRLGWDTKTVGPDGDVRPPPLISTTSPLVKLTKMNVRKEKAKLANAKKRKMSFGAYSNASSSTSSPANQTLAGAVTPGESSFEHPPLEDGYVYVGSLKVQIIENLLRCPADGCFKNFRTPTLLQMHIKHYHREMRKLMGATPKVADLASARATPLMPDKIKSENEPKVPKLKINKKRFEEVKPELAEYKYELKTETSPMTTPTKTDPDNIPRSQDSPRLRTALASRSKPHKRPRVLLPVRKEEQGDADSTDSTDSDIDVSSNVVPLDFESAISTHTVTKPISSEKKKKGEKRKKTFATISKVKPGSEDEEWGANSDYETRSSFPRSGSPDSKLDTPTMPVSSESTEDQKDPNMYMLTETGERIKLVHMKREEIINCHCTVREEDGLMIQCELCLCWQHALCHNIHKEAEVPEKYTCSICLNPRLGRRSRRFLHDQDRLYEGLLPGARACPSLRRAHELSGNLLGIQDALHALRVKNYVATKKDHPKLYLWASEWETGESFTSALTADYADFSAMINSLNKENMPHDDVDRLSRGAGGSQLGSLSGLLSSPGGASLDLPISTSDLERLAKSVQEAEALRTNVIVPQPEAPIENSVCRERLLRHIRRCQALVDARLDSIEAQVAELESQDPSFEDDETADYFPRTKQTIQMLLRDLDTMEELAVIT